MNRPDDALQLWDPVPLSCQPTLFPLDRAEFLRLAAVPIERLQEWVSIGWLSFDPLQTSPLEEFHLAEIHIVRSVLESGIPIETAREILSQLPKPLQYEPTRLGYNFHLRKWQMVPDRSIDMIQEELESEFHANLNEHIGSYVESLVEEGDLDDLVELLADVTRAIQKVKDRPK